MSSAPLKLRDFRRWLAGNTRRRFKVGSCVKCPIARFLQEVRGSGAKMYYATYLVPVKGSRKKSELPAPAWAQRFVLAFDAPGVGMRSAIDAHNILIHSAYRKG